MSRAEDNEHMRKALCAFDQFFGVDPALGLQSAATAARHGPCESTAQGITQGPASGAAGSLTLSNGKVVRYRVEYGAVGFWLASEIDYDLGRPCGTGISRDGAVDELRMWLEAELP